jgi:uncharacterized protein
VVSSVLTAAAGLSESVLARAPVIGRMAGQGRALEEVEHRPWPPPDGPWVMAQTWEDLLFAHWPVEPATLRRVVPPELPVDRFDGTAWIGVTPFQVRALRPRGLPPPPVASWFPEVNVRTYATLDGRPGIWFFSLDAASRFAVAGARRLYRLPYFHARMTIARDGPQIRDSSRRDDPRSALAELAIEYGPIGAAFQARPGSLEYFLTERYCLYALDERRRLLRAEIHHPPWPLRPAAAEVAANTMARPLGIELPDAAPRLHFAARQDVVIWGPEAVR